MAHEPADAATNHGRKLAEQVATAIRRDIVARGWPVGVVLGAEHDLVERYGVSRAALREAVRIVEFLGVARMRQGPGGGLVVAAPDATAVTSAVLVYFASIRVRLEEVLGARRVIEEMAVVLAAERSTPEAIAAFRRRLDTPTTPVSERDDQWEFHDLIARLAANPGIELFVKILNRITALYAATGRRSASRRRQERLATAVSHELIADAVCGRDPARARDAMRAHLGEIEEFLLSRRGRATVTIGDPQRDFPGTKLGGQIAVQVLGEVVDRGWPVGELLGSEATLMQRYQVSRAVMREAIRLLEFHRVVTTRRGPGGGVLVSEPSADAVTEAMAVHLEFEGLDRQQLFEVRRALELAAVELAATNLDEAAEVELRAAVADERDGREEVVVGHALHGRIAAVAGNRALWLFLLVLVRLTEERGSRPSPDQVELIGRVHGSIVDAILAGDPETARRRMGRHLDALTPLVR